MSAYICCWGGESNFCGCDIRLLDSIGFHALMSSRPRPFDCHTNEVVRASMHFENAAEPSISNFMCGAGSIRLNVLLRYPLRNLLARCNGLRPSHGCPVFLAMPDPFHFVSSNSGISAVGFSGISASDFSPSYAQRGHPHPPSYPLSLRRGEFFRSHSIPIIKGSQ